MYLRSDAVYINVEYVEELNGKPAYQENDNDNEDHLDSLYFAEKKRLN
jgi:hypothetical protein